MTSPVVVLLLVLVVGRGSYQQLYEVFQKYSTWEPNAKIKNCPYVDWYRSDQMDNLTIYMYFYFIFKTAKVGYSSS